MEKHSSVTKNHTIPVISGIIIVILLITVLYQNRRIHDLEKVSSNIYKAEKKQAESGTDIIPLKTGSDNKPVAEENECQARVRELESRIADMQSWQDYLEETLKKENGGETTIEDRIYRSLQSGIASRIKSFAEEISLPENKKTELIDLLVERELALRDLFTNRSSRENIKNESENIRSNYENLISDLLSPDNYIEYKEYQESEQDRNLVKTIARSVLTADNQLDQQQQKDLVAAIYRKRKDYEASDEMKELKNKAIPGNKGDLLKMIKAQKKLYKEYIDAAGDILTDPQMKRFKEYIELRISSDELTEKQLSLMPDRFGPDTNR